MLSNEVVVNNQFSPQGTNVAMYDPRSNILPLDVTKELA